MRHALQNCRQQLGFSGVLLPTFSFDTLRPTILANRATASVVFRFNRLDSQNLGFQ